MATKDPPGHQSHPRSHARIMRGPGFGPFPAAELLSKKGFPAGTHPRNRSPEQCSNDQMHTVWLQIVHAALAEVTGQGLLFRRRPRDDSCRFLAILYRFQMIPAEFLQFQLISNDSRLILMHSCDFFAFPLLSIYDFSVISKGFL